MNKHKEKTQTYNTEILQALAERFDFSVDYVRKCLRGARVGIMPDKVKKEYSEALNALTRTINEVKNK
jgi:hypothetical protein